MAWMRAVSGRLESRYQYSNSITYNNFPWPALQANIHAPLEACAQAVLDARAAHANASLADLYDPLTMPANLLKAHQALDKAVDAAYGYKGANTDAARVAFLFERYQQLTSLLPTEKSKKPLKRANNTCPARQYPCGFRIRLSASALSENGDAKNWYRAGVIKKTKKASNCIWATEIRNSFGRKKSSVSRETLL